MLFRSEIALPNQLLQQSLSDRINLRVRRREVICDDSENQPFAGSGERVAGERSDVRDRPGLGLDAAIECGVPHARFERAVVPANRERRDERPTQTLIGPRTPGFRVKTRPASPLAFTGVTIIEVSYGAGWPQNPAAAAS